MQDIEHRKGITFAICAYTLWGFAPLYFKLLTDVSATEILLHRVLWSFVFVALLMSLFGGFSRVRQLLKKPKQLAVLCITSLLIAANWLLFIWAVNNDHMLDASLGYFINPLVNVFLAMLFLGERLRKLQWAAVSLAAIGVSVQLISFGSIPLVSLALAGSFACYGLLRKKVNVDAKTGLLVETAILMPIALIYLLSNMGDSMTHLLNNDMHLNLLLLAAGVVTTVPLLCFSAAAVRIPFTMLGFFQYIGPSIMFILAVNLFNEPFDIEKGITFAFIWAALALFTVDMFYKRKQKK
ncbi:EamA family transporter RarD [Shewanella sp. Choline-02u-19]|jgi:chloramphenicol-sensitive protein RarD|uniref:EamA family transporter RarD n=1 Tax=unclassified Shewanella TaxID=196818 RepID=UPI000C320E30|nr:MULTISPECIES: EamA family transporter RarD [unclassified Shewanella]PKG56778.1 EamA family transporter RarD [Shewanella sp. GutDb-MelDb]PKG75677.1 EamA family transporter RarD [Shewanella sp. GutCb]PKH60578.1 EamA family transporter RarD [Shewanella sp. Bg11-22]PKI30426.1 EamA family transporter RarD [Shewanella sp. Choline-02u-19]